ncbi:OmpA family protein [Fortiea contorta]|uniref:OmpA family protein n=1 Tax=Fortiea contorta TaxID=1892405 RepID=UPI00034AD860|nr:OmpA family protein [Fortiea contorta]
MTQVEDAVPEDIDLNQEQALQLDNFVNLLVELKIITPPEQCLAHSALETTENEEHITELEIPEQHTYSPTIIEEESIQFNSYEPTDENQALAKLQELLLGTELIELHQITNSIQQDLNKLEIQIYEPTQLINLLLPSISELLRIKIADSQEEIAQIIVPIIEQAIRSRTEEDKASMGSALAPAVPIAISQQILISPEEVSDAFAPTMGRAIKKQIEIEQDIIVDALYPIIGSTITKYLAETIRAINQQVEETLSVKGIKRKIRAKFQGISEAELILKEAIPFTVQAIFLIHKASGLIISDIQPANEERLESEMIAGMLTAIRSFANDCITTSGSVSELDAIEYGTSKIILEVAGYCYLAIVSQGEPSKSFIKKMRCDLGKIVKDYGKIIEQFDGNPDTIPKQIHTTLAALQDDENQHITSKNRLSPLLILIFSFLSAILIPWGIWQYNLAIIRSIENEVSLALASTPELALYRLTVQEEKSKLKLTGRVPNQVLQKQAEKVAKSTAPAWLIDNQILSVEVPTDLVLAAAEVKRVTTVLNKMDGVKISTRYSASKVFVDGSVNRVKDTHIIQSALEQIPGVKSIFITVQISFVNNRIRFYFEPNSATVKPVDLEDKIKQVKLLLEQHPMHHVKIVGYSYSPANTAQAQQLALARAQAVQQALIDQGVEQFRLKVFGLTTLPPEVDAAQPNWLNRCVVLELVSYQ